jgi:hypothetical protein
MTATKNAIYIGCKDEVTREFILLSPGDPRLSSDRTEPFFMAPIGPYKSHNEAEGACRWLNGLDGAWNRRRRLGLPQPLLVSRPD